MVYTQIEFDNRLDTLMLKHIESARQAADLRKQNDPAAFHREMGSIMALNCISALQDYQIVDDILTEEEITYLFDLITLILPSFNFPRRSILPINTGGMATSGITSYQVTQTLIAGETTIDTPLTTEPLSITIYDSTNNLITSLIGPISFGLVGSTYRIYITSTDEYLNADIKILY
jgi:hypothetical protein